jgi:hypothetical protein
MTDSTDHITGKASLAPTVTIAKDGAGFGAPIGAITEVGGAGNGNGWYQLAATGADTDTLGQLIIHATAAGADPADMMVEVVKFDPQVVAVGAAVAGAAMTFSDDAITAAKIDTGAIEVAAFAADVGSTALLTNPLAQAAAKGAWDSLTADHSIASTYGQQMEDNLDAEVSTRSTLTAANVWDYPSADLDTALSTGLWFTQRLDTNVGSRGTSTYAGGPVDSVTGDVGGKVLGGGPGVIGATGVQAQIPAGGITATEAPALGNLDTNVGSRSVYAGGAADANIGAVKAVTDKLDTGLVTDGPVWQWTANALELGPAGGGGGLTAAQVWDYPISSLTTGGSVGKWLYDVTRRILTLVMSR